MSPELQAYLDRARVLENDRRRGYTVASTCNWRDWYQSEAVWWARGLTTAEDMDYEFGDDAHLVCEQYRAYLEGGNFAWGQMLKVLAMRHCHSRTRPRPRRSMSVYEFMGF